MSAVKDERGRMYDGAGDGLRTGVRVKLHSLQANPEYNGKCGTLVDFKVASGRWEVELAGGDRHLITAANLTKTVGVQGKKAADGDASSGEADPAMVSKMVECQGASMDRDASALKASSREAEEEIFPGLEECFSRGFGEELGRWSQRWSPTGEGCGICVE